MYLINYRPVNKDECIDYCINNTQCTSIIYSEVNRDCSLKRFNDVSKGVYRQDVDLISLKSKISTLTVFAFFVY